MHDWKYLFWKDACEKNSNDKKILPVYYYFFFYLVRYCVFDRKWHLGSQSKIKRWEKYVYVCNKMLLKYRIVIMLIWQEGFLSKISRVILL